MQIIGTKLGAAAATALFMTGLASANLITMYTPSGSQNDGLDVDMTTVFNITADTVTITMTNNQADPSSVAQNISDLQFVLSSGETIGTLSSSSGLERWVNSDKTYTDGSIVDTGWELETSGSGLRLHVLGTDVGPAHTIIGDHGSGNKYNNAGGSIKSNGPHNPFLAGDVTYTLNVPGVLENATIKSAYASFGTTEGHNVDLIPEPTTGLMLVGLLILARRRG